MAWWRAVCVGVALWLCGASGNNVLAAGERNGTENLARCWAAMQNEPPQSLPTTQHLLHMSLFVSDFSKLLNITEIYFCIKEGAWSGGGVAERVFASTLSRRLLYFLPCNMTQMGTTMRALNEGGTVKDGALASLHYPAALHLTSRGAMAATLASLWNGTDNDIGDAIHIILGYDLPPCRIHLATSARWFQASYSVSSGQVVAEEVYVFGDGGASLPVGVASWRPRGESGGVMTVKHQPGLGPLDFLGHTVKLVTITGSPFVMKKQPCVGTSPGSCKDAYLAGVTLGRQAGEGAEEEQVEYSGYLVDLITTVAKALNFSIRLMVLPPDDYEYGVDRGNGTYTGLVGALQTSKVDIGLAALSMTTERLQVMDFSVTVGYTGVALYVQQNASLETIGWDTFVLSFHWGTWLAIMVLLAVVTLGFWLIVRHLRSHEDPHFTDTYNIAFILFSCLVQQGSWILPSSGYARAVLWLFWFTSLVLYASYTAVLTSFLTVSSVALPFTTLEQAVNTPGWRIAIMKGISTIKTLQKSREESYRRVYEGLENDPSLLFSTNQEGIDLIMSDPKLASFSDQISFSYILKDNCLVTEVPGTYLPGYLYMGYRKRLPYADIINRELGKMAAGGLMNRIYKRWWGTPIPCLPPTSYSELGFSHILTAFLILLGGMVLSSTILVAEIIVYKTKMASHSGQSSLLNSHSLGKPRPGVFRYMRKLDQSAFVTGARKELDSRTFVGRVTTIDDKRKLRQMPDIDISKWHM